jgi:hypothetical protein
MWSHRYENAYRALMGAFPSHSMGGLLMLATHSCQSQDTTLMLL